MKLKTLAGKPADFKFDVTVRELDGSEVKVPFIGVGRTVTEWQPIHLARLEKDTNMLIEQEEKREAERAKTATDDEKQDAKPKKRERVKIPKAEVAKATADGLTAAVALVREFAQGWGLDDEFTDENIKQLIARYPGVQQAGWQEYDRRVKGLREKN